MQVQNQYEWIFNKEKKDIIVAKSNLFNEPVIFTSDLHSYGYAVFDTLGDMAGDTNRGTDADPTDLYRFISENSKEFYYVQGNHDLRSEETEIHNIENGKCVNSSIGKIGGINGIISNKKKLYRLCEIEYINHIHTLLKENVEILLTHDTPALPVIDSKYKTMCIGQKSIYSNLKGPLIHVYGHCHHTDFYHNIKNIHFINADARVIIVIPNEYDQDLYKYDLENLYL